MENMVRSRKDYLRRMLVAQRDYANNMLEALEGESERFGDEVPGYPLWVLERLVEGAVKRGVRNAAPIACQMAASGIDSSFQRLLVLPGNGRQGVGELRRFVQDATRLTIIDPYIYSGNVDVDSYLKSFSVATGIGSESSEVRSLHIIYGSKMKDSRTRQALHELLEKYNCSVTDQGTKLIHDRVWIADQERAVVVGTSLNGLGSRAAFILDLPSDDLQNLLAFLKSKHLINRNS